MSPKKAKILFIGPTPPPYSGPELSMQQFLDSEILNEEFEIIFLKTNFRKDNVNKGRVDFSMILNFFSYFSKLFFHLVIHRPKLVYYPITITQVGWIGRDGLTILFSKLFKKKVLIHMRGSHFKLNVRDFHPIIKKFTEFSLSKTDMAIVQAEYLKSEFEPFISSENVKVLYQSIKLEEFVNREIDGYCHNKILVVGHLTKAKGFTDIVKIIPTIAEEFPDVQFCFAGNIRRGERNVFFNQVTGEAIIYEDPIEVEKEILKSPYKKNYKNLGIITGNEKLKAFKDANIFITASYSEGFSRAMLEAMTMGKPLIYTPVGAHREVLENGVNGILINPGKPKELTNAIRKLLINRKLRNSIAKNNYDKARREFTIQKVAKDFKNIIHFEL